MLNSSAAFFVKGGDVGFADRERKLFDCLNAAENEKNEREGSSLNSTNTFEDMDVEVPSRKRRRAETKHFRGKESIFKKPGDPPPKFKIRDIPDHHRNPHKWIRYSLGDVSSEDMSDKCNTATALSFLRELELRRKGLMEEEIEDCDSSEVASVLFKRPSQKNITTLAVPDNVVNYPDVVDKAVFKSSKLIMPEYVVGRSNKKEKKAPSTSPGTKYDKTKEIKLDHLEDDDPE